MDGVIVERRRTPICSVRDELNRNGFLDRSPMCQAFTDAQEAEAYALFQADVAAARKCLTDVTGVYEVEMLPTKELERGGLGDEFSRVMAGLHSTLTAMEEAERNKMGINRTDVFSAFKHLDRLSHVCRKGIEINAGPLATTGVA